MLNKTKCDYCSTLFDVFKDKCPSCGQKNNNKPRGWCYETMTFLSIPKELILFFAGWLGFQIVGLLISLILTASFKNITTDASEAAKANLLLQIISYGLLTIGLLAIMRKDFAIVCKSFRNKFSFLGIICGGIVILFSIVYSIITANIQVNANQQAVVQTIVKSPFVSFVMVVLLGPFCEEITYRIGLYSVLRRKSRAVALICSMLIFAFIHFDFSSLLSLATAQTAKALEDAKNAVIVELINIPSYVIAGFLLGLTYEFFGFAGSLYAHITNNLVSWISTVATPAAIGITQLLIR